MSFWKKEKITKGALGLSPKEKRPATPVLPDKAPSPQSAFKSDWLKNWQTSSRLKV